MSHYFRSSLDSYNEHKLIDKDTSDLLTRLPLHFKFPSVKHKLTNWDFKTSISLSFFLSTHPLYLGSALCVQHRHSRVEDRWLKWSSPLSLLTFSTLTRKMEWRSANQFGFYNQSSLNPLLAETLQSLENLWLLHNTHRDATVLEAPCRTCQSV